MFAHGGICWLLHAVANVSVLPGKAVCISNISLPGCCPRRYGIASSGKCSPRDRPSRRQRLTAGVLNLGLQSFGKYRGGLELAPVRVYTAVTKPKSVNIQFMFHRRHENPKKDGPFT